MQITQLFETPHLYVQVALLLLTLCYAFFKIKRWNYEKYAEQIPGDQGLPIIGHAYMLWRVTTLTDVLAMMKNIKEKYPNDGIAKFWLGPKLWVIVWDPSYIETTAKSDNLKKGSVYYKIHGRVLNGVFAAPEGPRWKELKKPVMKSLAKKYLNEEYLDTFIKCSKKFGDHIIENELWEHADVKTEISLLLMEIFLDTHFGIKGKDFRQSFLGYERIVSDFFAVNFRVFRKYYYLSWDSVDKYTHLGQELNDILKKWTAILDWIFETVKKDKLKRGDDLEYYSEFLLRRAAEKNQPKEDMYREAADVLLGGTDTSTTVMSGALLYLAMFPEYQEQAYREVQDIFGESDRDPTLEDLSRMKYLQMVIKETLRITAAPGVLKVTTGDVKMGKYTIPKDSLIYTFMYAVHRDPKHWERPNSFYPDHFLPEKEQARPRYAYIPFSVGHRMCPGSQYITIAGLVILSTLLRSFKFTTNMKYEDLSYEYAVLLSVKSGYPVRFQRRIS